MARIRFSSTWVFKCLFCILWGMLSVQAQDSAGHIIKGVVTDVEGRPISGSSILVKGTSRGARSGVNGSFSIKVYSTDKHLVISFIGMESLEVPILSGKEHYAIVLRDAPQRLDEVVVTGYQTISKERTTGSYFIVDKKEINKKLNSSIIGRLEGVIAGVQGRADGDIKIRGLATLMGNSRPLIVVDNMPLEGSLSNINPSTIESITVLKDAAAASIYGARAANGVIVINTLKGNNTDSFRVSYDGSVLFMPRPSYDYLNRMSSEDLIDISQYILDSRFSSLKWSAIEKWKQTYPYFMELYSKRNEGLVNEADYNTEVKKLKSFNNAQIIRDELLGLGILHTHNLTLIQSGKKNRYVATINYKGDTPNDLRQRNSALGFSFRNIAQFTDRLSSDIVFAGNYDYSSSEDGVPDALSLITKLPSYQPIFNDKGDFLNLPTERSEYSINQLISKGLEDEHYNPLRDRGLEWTREKNNYTRLNARLGYQVLPELSVAGYFQIETRTQYQKSYLDRLSYSVRRMRNDATIKENDEYLSLIPNGGQLQEFRSGSTNYTGRLQANYDKSFGSTHRVTALVGTEVRRLHSTVTSSYLMGYDDISLGSIPYDAARLSNLSGTQSLSGSFSFNNSGHNYVRDHDDRFFSIYFNFAYDCRQKYNITGSLRVDQSNLFGVDPKVQYRPLWSLGASWAMHREDFMKFLTWIDRLAPRITYGIGGNIPKVGGPYLIAKTGIYNQLSHVSASQIVSPPNRSLTWERTATLNLGLDFSFWRNKLSGSIEIYNRATSNLLGNRLVDPTVGWNSILMNYGTMNNKGIELTLNSINIDRSSFRWSSGFVFGYNRNRILKIDEPDRSVEKYITNGIQTAGKPSNSLYSLSWGGLYAINNDGNKIELGEPHVYTTDNEGQRVLTREPNKMEDLIHEGTMTPIWNGSFSNTFEYNGLSISFSFVYYGGHKLRDVMAPYIGQIEFLTSGLNLDAGLKNAWRKPGDELLSITTPMMAPNMPSSASRSAWYGADIHVISGDYLRLRNLVFAYNVPSRILSFLNISECTFRFQANNLFYWAKNDRGIDPEAYSFAFGRPPRRLVQEPTSYMLGLSMTF